MTDDSLSEELRDLLASERHAAGAPADVRARLAARLATSVASGASTGPLRTSGARAWTAAHGVAVAAAFVVGVASGAAGILLTREERRPIVAVAPPPPEVPPAEAAPPAPARVVPSAPIVSAAPPAPPAVAPAPPRPLASASSLTQEQAILDTARVALGRDDGAAALASSELHARRFPHGELVEEREAIAIQALVLLRRDGEARARAERFAHAYPTSALLGAVRDALGGAP